MEVVVITHMKDLIEEDIEIGDKYFEISHQGRLLYKMVFKKIINIREVLLTLYSALSKIEERSTLERYLNILYFIWQQEQSEEENIIKKLASY